jgi:phosphopantothenoylcysteine decarboxylase/phosphopantothenate--cysteine ligase
MNVNMWMHPATQANVQILKKRGIILVPPEHGALACGVQGKGRMAEVEDIMKIVTRIARHIKKTNIGGLCHD